MLNDLYLEWGADLTIGSSGDLAVVTANDMTDQRVLRRLLTNSGDYIWNLSYGGNLGQFVGTATSAVEIEAIIRTQMALEAAVSDSPAPVVDVQPVSAGTGYLAANITYSSISSGKPRLFSLPLN